MDALVQLWERPEADEVYMIAGWEQWADAGSISSGLPGYLIEQSHARQIGEIDSNGFYLFQLPGAHHFLRPQITLKEGYRRALTAPKNGLYYVGDERKGVVIFAGEEPHLNADRYTEALLSAAETLGVRRGVALGGVYGAMPYDQDREISCVYSLQWMKDELARYAVKFSNYEGGTTIGTYVVSQAEHHGLEFLSLYAFVPSYDLSQLASVVQVLRIENDFRAWYEVMRRVNDLFGTTFDLAELKQQSEDLTLSMHRQVEELESKLPELGLRAYLEGLAEEFTPRPYVPPLSDLWGRALGNLLKDADEDPSA